MNQLYQSPTNNVSHELRAFGFLGIVSMIIILVAGNIEVSKMIVIPAGLILALLWVRLSNTPWREIGYTKPKNWATTIAGGLIIGVVFKLFMKTIIMPLFHAEPVNSYYHFLVGNNALLPVAIWAVLLAGFGEETIFRGYMFERLGKLIGTAPGAKAIIIIITSALFGLGHYYNQGISGVEQATIVGLLFGTIYSFTGSIWLIMIAHAVFDLTAVIMIYYNLETEVAHFIFK